MRKLFEVISFHLSLGILLLVVIVMTASGCGDSGQWSWVTDEPGEPAPYSYAYPLLFDRQNNNIYASYGGGLLLCSNPDTKPEWTELSHFGDMIFPYGLVHDETRDLLYLSFESGVKRCDNAETPALWVDIGGVSGIHSMVIDPVSNIVYTGTFAGVYQCISPDSDPQWSNTGGGVDGSTVYGLVCDRVHNAVYADNDNMGIGIWKYQGGTWSDILGDASKPDYLYRAGSMVYDGDNDVLYAAAGEAGIMRCDHPASDPVWTEYKPPEGPYYFRTVTLDTANNVLYAGALELEMEGPIMLNEDVDRLSKSKGVWICEDPLNNLSLKKLDGMVSEDDIHWLSFDSERGVLYGESLNKGIWRYDAE